MVKNIVCKSENIWIREIEVGSWKPQISPFFHQEE